MYEHKNIYQKTGGWGGGEGGGQKLSTVYRLHRHARNLPYKSCCSSGKRLGILLHFTRAKTDKTEKNRAISFVKLAVKIHTNVSMTKERKTLLFKIFKPGKGVRRIKNTATTVPTIPVKNNTRFSATADSTYRPKLIRDAGNTAQLEQRGCTRMHAEVGARRAGGHRVCTSSVRNI